ncbi:MAG TPA: 4Fe-4S binding protein [Acidobacteriota bacterium]|nr:4Fe-4S binding protein [Acidobacteriota bacterium]
MGRVTITIDGHPIEVEEGSFVLTATRQLGIDIPTLCHFPYMQPYAACRLCVVEARDGKGWSKIVTACNYPAWEGLIIRTDSDRVLDGRRLNLEMLMSRCARLPVLEELAAQLGIDKPRWGYGEDTCVLCGLCVRVCDEIVGAHAICFTNRGIFREVSTPFNLDSDSCILCGACAMVCPTGHIQMEEVVRPEIGHPDLQLGPNAAISVPTRQAVPNVPRINPDYCIHFKTGGCGICSSVCEKDAINYEDEDAFDEIEVGSVVLATGFKGFDARRIAPYGYGRYPNVYTSLEIEQMINASSPTGGQIVLRDGFVPKSIGIIHCVGSRDEHTNRYCSRVCCMYSLKLAHLVKERTGGEVFNFYIDMRTPGKGYEEFYDKLLKEGVHFIRGRAAEVTEWAMTPEEEGRLVIRAEDTLIGTVRRIPVDMVILSVGLEPQADAEEVGRLFNISCSKEGWFLERHPKLAPVSTFTDGIFLAGACQGPKDIPDSVAQGGAAAAEALVLADRGYVELEPITAYIDEDTCSGCKTCVAMCPFSAISFKVETGKSETNEALCKGCGTCVAACPSGAAQQHLFTDEEIYEEIEGVLTYV